MTIMVMMEQIKSDEDTSLSAQKVACFGRKVMYNEG